MPLDLNMVDNFHFAPPPKASGPPLTDCNRGVDTQGACQEERWGHRAIGQLQRNHSPSRRVRAGVSRACGRSHL